MLQFHYFIFASHEYIRSSHFVVVAFVFFFWLSKLRIWKIWFWCNQWHDGTNWISFKCDYFLLQLKIAIFHEIVPEWVSVKIASNRYLLIRYQLRFILQTSILNFFFGLCLNKGRCHDNRTIMIIFFLRKIHLKPSNGKQISWTINLFMIVEII